MAGGQQAPSLKQDPDQHSSSEAKCLIQDGSKCDKEVEADVNKHNADVDGKLEGETTESIRRRMREEPWFFAVVFLAALVQGSDTMSSLVLSYLLKDELGVDPGVSQTVAGVLVLPWIVKPLWGFISDGVPIFGYRRRSYLFLSGLVGALCWLSLALVPNLTLLNVTALRLTISLSTAFLSTVSKALIVEHCFGQSQQYASFLQFYFWSVMYTVSLIASIAAGQMLGHVSKRTIFAIEGLFPLMIALVAPFITETRSFVVQPISTQCSRLYRAFVGDHQTSDQPFAIWRPALFLLLYGATPGSGSAMFYFLTEKLGFSQKFMALTGTVSTATTLVGIMVYQFCLSTSPYRIVLIFASILSIAFSALPILVVTRWNRTVGIPDQLFVLTDDAMAGAIGEIAMFPLFVLAARICPPGVEGTLYALLMSISNLGTMLSNELGALLTHLLGITKTNYDNLPTLIAICAISAFLPLFLVPWLLPSSDAETHQGAVSVRQSQGQGQQIIPDSAPERTSNEVAAIASTIAAHEPDKHPHSSHAEPSRDPKG